MKSLSIRFGNWIFGGFVQYFADRFAIGITNETEDNYFLPFLDYDGVYFHKVVKDIKHLQSVFNLGNFVILASKEEEGPDGEYGNYQVFGLDKLPFQLCGEVIAHSRSDRMFKFMPRRMLSRNWVLRVGAKKQVEISGDKPVVSTFKPVPKYKLILHGNGIHEQSKAHWEFLRKKWRIRASISGRFDRCKEVEVIQYPVWSD